MLRLYDKQQPDYLPGMSSAEKKLRLAKMSYQDFLLNVAKVDPQVLWFFRHFGEDVFCVGADATPALFAWQMGQPGFSGLQLDPTPEGVLSELPGVQHGRQKEGGGAAVHFPDGNATIARLLVRWLIPDAVPGKTMEDVGAARINYALLDRSNQPARIRLNSTVLNVRHDGDPAQASEVVVSYNRGGKMYDVRAKACVMACWNMFIPYLVPELPAAQKEALAYAVKGPLVYTSVGVKNWKAWQKLGVSYINAPTMYHPGGLAHGSGFARRLEASANSGGTDRAASGQNHVVSRQDQEGTTSAWDEASCWPQPLKPSSATFAISWRACWARAASIRRATSSTSPSIAGRTATRTPTTASLSPWNGYSPTPSIVPM